MDRLSAELAPLENFILPGGARRSRAAARRPCGLPAGRAIRRRPRSSESVGAFVVKYLNRLSDALFVMARYENLQRGIDDPLWDSRA